ncbi:hypothetical protein ACWDUL_33770 [Nocardia niigatensis]
MKLFDILLALCGTLTVIYVLGTASLFAHLATKCGPAREALIYTVLHALTWPGLVLRGSPAAEFARQSVIDSVATSFTPSAHLRGSLPFTDGSDPDRVRAVLGALSDGCGVQLVCLWDNHDPFGYDGCDFTGNPELYFEAGGRFFKATGDLPGWLEGGSDAPSDPGDPRTWIGDLNPHWTVADVAYSDPSGHNQALDTELS